MNMMNPPNCRHKPPTPPLHRCPSWESRIYNLAQSSVVSAGSAHAYRVHQHDTLYLMQPLQLLLAAGQQSQTAIGTTNADRLLSQNSTQSPLANGRQTCAFFSSNTLSALACPFQPEGSTPVFACYKGIASQIRNEPLSDLSSDNSDDEHVDCSPEKNQKSPDRHQHNVDDDENQSGDYYLPPDAIDSAQQRMQKCSLDSDRKRAEAMNKPILLSNRLSMKNCSPLPSSMLLRSNRTNASPSGRDSVMSQAKFADEPELSEQKCGFLLCCKQKSWKQRYFVLRDGQLMYFRTQSDAHKTSKAVGRIELGSQSQVTRLQNSTTFQITSQPNVKPISLTADSMLTMEEWIRVILNTLKRSQSHDHHPSADQHKKPSTIEGWCTQLKHGHHRRLFFALVEQQLLYFRDQNKNQSIGAYDLTKFSVSELQASDTDENNDTDTGFGSLSVADERNNLGEKHEELSIVLRSRSNKTAPIFLLFDRKQDANLWMYHLAVAADTGDNGSCSPFEQLIQSLMRLEMEQVNDGDDDDVNGGGGDDNRHHHHTHPQHRHSQLDASPLWKNPLMVHSRESIERPLTSLKSVCLQNEALKLFKSIQLFTMVSVSAAAAGAGIEYHVALAQGCFESCFEHPSLQDELFAQLIKQSSLVSAVNQSHLVAPASASSSSSSSSSTNTSIKDKHHHHQMSKLSASSQKQTFQLLALACSVFLPHGRFLWLLRQHLRRYSNEHTDVGQYAIYCQRALERLLVNGSRELRPSRLEVLSILLRNPYQHSRPHSIPVHFVNQEYLVIGFDGSTTVREFAELLNEQAGIRPKTGFALYCDDPSGNGDDDHQEHLLPPNAKIGDIISRWELLLKTHRLGKFESKRSPKLSYKTRLLLLSELRTATQTERVLAMYQLNEQIRHGLIPIEHLMAVQLCALLIRYESATAESITGHKERLDELIRNGISKFYPKCFEDKLIMHVLGSELKDALRPLEQSSASDCVRIYLNCLKRWPLFGSQLFQTFLVRVPKWFSRVNCKCWIAVDEQGIQLLDFDTFQPWIRFPYDGLFRFGGYKGGLFQLLVSMTVNPNDHHHHHHHQQSPLNNGSFGSPNESANGSNRGESFRKQRFLFSFDRNKQLELSSLLSDHLSLSGSAFADNFKNIDDLDAEEPTSGSYFQSIVQPQPRPSSSCQFTEQLSSLPPIRNVSERQSRLVRMPATPQMGKRFSTSSSGFGGHYLNRAGSLDRKLSQYSGRMTHDQQYHLGNNSRNHAYDDSDQFNNANESGDYYSETYSPTKENRSSTFFASNQLNDENIDLEVQQTRPPTPPQHNCPAWEINLYKMATGAFVNSREFSFPVKDIQTNSGQSFQHPTTSSGFEAPVYSNVNGRPVRMDSFPLSDDESSYSSEEESFEGIRPLEINRDSSKTSIDCSLSQCPSLNIRRNVSIESSISEDYVIPPDAVSATASYGAISSLSGSKRKSGESKESRLPVESVAEIPEKSGFLHKLNAKGKWKRRFFISKDTCLIFFNSDLEANRNRPAKGKFQLTASTEVSKCDDTGGFRIVDKGLKKSRHQSNQLIVRGDSSIVNEEWIRHLRLVKKRYFDQCARHAAASIETWVLRIHNGKQRRCWAALLGTQLCFFHFPAATDPLVRLELTGCQVSCADCSDSEDLSDRASRQPEHRQRIFDDGEEEEHILQIVSESNQADPTYVQFESQVERDLWLFHLNAAAIGQSVIGTPFEQVITKLLELEASGMDAGEFDRHPLWTDVALQFTKEMIENPLTTLPTSELQQEAVKLFRSIQMFITVELSASAIEYHVALAQTSLEIILERPQLQTELYAQLLKLSTYHLKWTDANACPDRSSLQAFQLLALTCSMCLPNGRLLWYLRHYLRRVASESSQLGQYASYCERAIERCVYNGIRVSRPSRMEVLSILQRNPYQHSMPHSIPVHLTNGEYSVIGFDGSSTVDEITASLCDQLNIRPAHLSGFALYADDPVDRLLQHPLRLHLKLADLISQWESVHKQTQSGKCDGSISVRLSFRCRIYLKKDRQGETDRERQLILHQLWQQICAGQFPATVEFVMQMAALMAQLELGRPPPQVNATLLPDFVQKTFERICPPKLRTRTQSSLIDEFYRKWTEIAECTRTDCVRVGMNCAKKWPFWAHRVFGCKTLKPIRIEQTTFKYRLPINTRLWIAIAEDSLSILNHDTMQPVLEYSMKDIITYGGVKENFFLAVIKRRDSCSGVSSSTSSTATNSEMLSHKEKFIFRLSRCEANEITHLITDCINWHQIGSQTVVFCSSDDHFRRISCATSRS